MMLKVNIYWFNTKYTKLNVLFLIISLLGLFHLQRTCLCILYLCIDQWPKVAHYILKFWNWKLLFLF